jgi:hypothetical protein
MMPLDFVWESMTIEPAVHCHEGDTEYLGQFFLADPVFKSVLIQRFY